MPDVSYHVEWDAVAIHELLRGRNGPVARDMLRRGNNVRNRAQQILVERGRTDHGRLRASITAVMQFGSVPICNVGTDVRYAGWVERGTGIYGPRGGRIYPKKPGGVLVFTPRKTYGGGFVKRSNRRTVFVRYTKGMPGIHFMRDAAWAAIL